MIDKLEFLLALARERHFARAAKVCGVTQPTLSAGVKQLEETFGLLLVLRGSRFRDFTPEGERVLSWARRIVGDAHAMRDEMRALKKGLAGQLRVAAVPTAVAVIERLITPYRERHPNVQFKVLSRSSNDILRLMENLEIDAGVTYLDEGPLGRVTAIPLYRERYFLLISGDAPLGKRDKVTWAEATRMPLCLLTPDMQNRRIIDRLAQKAGGNPEAYLESDAMILLYTHLRSGKWASIMPGQLAAMLRLTDQLRAIPIVEPEASNSIGLVVPAREPMTPLTAALVKEARRVAALMAD